MTAAYFFTQLINGIRLGSVYAIVAVGYSIVYGILKLINFAHGDIMTIGVYAIIVLMSSSGLPLWMTQFLSREKLYKTSFSKYGTAYQELISLPQIL